jgi:hypothetical protein
MSPELGDLLRALLEDPSKLAVLTPVQQQALIAGLCAAVDSPTRPAADAPASGNEDLLTVDEAAAVLRVSPRWLYRHAKNLPFARKLSRKVLRFSRSGIVRWLATKRL